MQHKHKQAFTFAELMIVVSIIGIIASFMIPALIRSEPNETALTYKKTVQAIEQAVRNTINDITLYPPLRDEREVHGRSPIAPAGMLENGDLRYITDPAITNAGDAFNRYQVDNNARFFCINLANQLNTIGTIRCPGDAGLANLNTVGTDIQNLTTGTTNFTLSNGATIGGISDSWGGGDINTPPFITLCIDVNGNLPPNVGCAIRDRANQQRDQFRLQINAEGRVYTGSPVGANNWYMENQMLINPRAVTKNQRPLSNAEITELTSINERVIGNTEEDCPQELGYILNLNRCIYTAGYSR